MVGASPVLVSGNGSPGAAFTVSINYNGKTGCAGIAACVGANLGPGLTYDEATGTIQAMVSRDSDNALTFGSDNGLFSGGSGGGGDTCRKSVGSLPAAPNVVGAWSMAGLLNPFNSPEGISYAIANQCDIVHMQVVATADGAGWVSEYAPGYMWNQRSTIYQSNHVKFIDSASVKATINMAGTVNNPYPGTQINPSRVWHSGWYGWGAQPFTQLLATDALDLIDGKTVALMECGDADDPASHEAANVQAVLRAVRTYCAQDWVMVGVEDIANGVTAQNAGVTAVMMPPMPATWGTTTLPYTVAELTTANIKWVALSHFHADSVFTAYKNAGIQVLMCGASRHVDRTRMQNLGIRGFLGHDPVYTRGPAPHDYRNQTDPWSRRRPGNGQLTHRTDQYGTTGIDVRGFLPAPAAGQAVNPEGLYIPPRWGQGGISPAILCGWACPLRNATNYTISLDMMFDTLPVSGGYGKMGLLFGMTDDRNLFAWNGADGNPQNLPVGGRSAYRAYQRTNGQVGIGYFDATGTWNILTEVASPVPAADVWNTYTLTVTPSTITFRRTTTSGANYTATATHSALRGGYFAVEKEELNPSNNQYGYQGAFRRLNLTNQGY